jgi:cation transport ATPase
MVYCPKCRTKNDNDAAFCTNCGLSLKSDAASAIERHAKRFAKDMEQMGKNLGESMAQTAKRIHEDTQDAGKRIEQKVDRSSRHAENWYDRRFSFLGPLISSFIFLIFLRLVIGILQIPENSTIESRTVATVLLTYLLPLFGISLLSNYTSYLARKSYKFRIFSPLFHAIAFIILLWIVAKILDTLRYRLSNPDLGTAATSLENSLPTVFVFVLLIGYVILAATVPREPERKP